MKAILNFQSIEKEVKELLGDDSFCDLIEIWAGLDRIIKRFPGHEKAAEGLVFALLVGEVRVQENGVIRAHNMFDIERMIDNLPISCRAQVRDDVCKTLETEGVEWLWVLS